MPTSATAPRKRTYTKAVYEGVCGGCGGCQGDQCWGNSKQAKQFSSPGRNITAQFATKHRENLPHYRTNPSANHRVCPRCRGRMGERGERKKKPTKREPLGDLPVNSVLHSTPLKPLPARHFTSPGPSAPGATPSFTLYGHQYYATVPLHPLRQLITTEGEWADLINACTCYKADKWRVGGEPSLPGCTGGLWTTRQPVRQGDYVYVPTACTSCDDTFVFGNIPTTTIDLSKYSPLCHSQNGKEPKQRSFKPLLHNVRAVATALFQNVTYDKYNIGKALQESHAVSTSTFYPIADCFWGACIELANELMDAQLNKVYIRTLRVRLSHVNFTKFLHGDTPPALCAQMLCVPCFPGNQARQRRAALRRRLRSAGPQGTPSVGPGHGLRQQATCGNVHEEVWA